jgi:uncharacterized phage protein gp47/JayE
MFFNIPKAEACLQRARAAFRSHLAGSDAWLSRNNVGPTAKVVGGSASDIYQRLDFVGQQAFVLFAKGKYLDYHGADFGITRRPAAPAAGTLALTATDAVSVANGAQFVRADGVVVAASAAVGLSAAGTLSVPVIASVAAQAGNARPGQPFTVLSGVTGPGAPAATVVVDGNGIVGGLDVEPDGAPRTTDLSTLRGRILFRKRNPPHGGAPADYVLWATTIPGVTRVFVERHWIGPGTLRVFPVFDGLFPGGIPDDAHVSLVRDYIATVAPAAAVVTVVPPTAQPIPVAVKNMDPNTEAVQAAVMTELADTVQRLGQVAGSDKPMASLPFLAVPYSFAAIWADQAVANASGNKRGIVLAPTADTTIASGAIPTLGPVMFT